VCGEIWRNGWPSLHGREEKEKPFMTKGAGAAFHDRLYIIYN
jgi:hypothetical protein